MSGLDDASLALLLDAVARRGNPLDRFIASLSPELATFARETEQLQRELVEHMQKLLASTEVREAVSHAEWITRHAHEVAFRWTSLRNAACRWTELDTESFTIRMGP